MGRNMDKKKIGRRIKEARQKVGFSQSELAEAINVTVSTISTIERGVRAPSLEVLVNILETLGTSADLVLQDVLECGFKIRETELDDKLQNLPREERERIFRVINVMVDKEYS